MYDYLKNISILYNWHFEYSRKDYQNLFDEMERNQINLFLDPVTIDSSFSESGTEKLTYSGKFMLLVSSDIDEEYKEKYVTNIKPLIDNAIDIIKTSLLCNDLDINKLQQTEIINLFDYNLDGVLVNYSITPYE